MRGNLISIRDISKEEIHIVFELAERGDDIFREYDNFLNKKVLGLLFFQPSTRTQFSFQSSFLKLGGNCITSFDIEQTRSGQTYCEPLDDMAEMLSNYCDIVVMRTSVPDDLKLLCKGSRIPIISAGAGKEEHPTQALIDLFTIKRVLGTIDSISILIIGSPTQRTVNSLLLGLSLWNNVKVIIMCEEGERVIPAIQEAIQNLTINYVHSWNELLSHNSYREFSAIYVTEIVGANNQNNKYTLSLSNYSNFKNHPIILSPLPRTRELPKSIDIIPSSQYFFQAKQGMYIRASLFVQYFK